jgi:hypothetical protein
MVGTSSTRRPPSLRRRIQANKGLPADVARSIRDSRRHRELFSRVETYCMFIGYPRSGHSLVGSILDAHPEAVVAHELDALRLLRLGFRRNQIWSMILERDAEFVAGGSAARLDYTYAIPGASQGHWTQLRVIGDKKGGQSTRAIRARPHLLDRVRRTMKVPLRVVHVTRNPFDNISTMAKRGRLELPDAIESYFQLVETVGHTRRQLDPAELLDIQHEQMIADPRSTITRLTGHMGLDATDEYIDACAATLFTSPRRTRENAPWTPELVDQTTERILEHDFLAGYRFDQ